MDGSDIKSEITGISQQLEIAHHETRRLSDFSNFVTLILMDSRKVYSLLELQ